MDKVGRKVTGKIVRLVPLKQFGFIRSDGKDYFFHKSSFNGYWDDLIDDFEGDVKIEVSFEPTQSSKGARAENVKRLDFPNQG
jgi:cold shock CspA family protein